MQFHEFFVVIRSAPRMVRDQAAIGKLAGVEAFPVSHAKHMAARCKEQAKVTSILRPA